MSPTSSRQESFGLVGNAAARSIRGFGVGATTAVVGPDGAGPDGAGPDGVGVARWNEVLSQICGPGTPSRPASLTDLADLADLAAGTDAANGPGAATRPLIVVDATLQLDLPGVLDLLDSPTDRTAVLVAEPRNVEAPRQPEHGLGSATVARADPDGRLLRIGSAASPLPGADRVVLGVLRVSAADRDRAAQLWRAAGQTREATGEVGGGSRETADGANPTGLVDRAIETLVAGGLAVGARTLGYYTWQRGDAGQTGLGRSAWQQRLRTSSRLGDGAYSAAVVRPLSRIGSRLGLAVGLTPNVVTMISLAVGIIAGLLILTGSYPLWIVAAIALQLALVVDCMDGEIARFTRRFSAFGGWLDGIGDRIKEYLVLAAVGAVAVAGGHAGGWLLAMIAMVIVTGRHLEDYAYGDRTRAVRAALADSSPSTNPGPAPDSGTAPDLRAGANGLRAPATRNQRISFWAKKIAHVPIAERYVILSLALLTGRPIWVLVAAIAVSGFALAWAVGGRLLRAARTPHPPVNSALVHQLDVGRPARLAGRLPIGYLPGMIAMLLCWLAGIVGICTHWWPLALIAAALAVVFTGSALREPSCHRYGWLALPLVWAGESAVIGSLLSWSVSGLLLFCVLAAIAYRRYELIYSLRLRGRSGPNPVLGFDGRILLVAALVSAASLAGAASGPVLGWGLVLLGAETLVEAVLGTVQRWRPH